MFHMYNIRMTENQPSTSKEKVVVVINGHPSEESLSGKHAEIAKKVAESKGYNVKYHRAINFPFVGHVMKEGYPEVFNEVADDITAAEVIVILTPMWNYNMTGSLKNFFDGAIQARKHFRYKNVPILNVGMPVGFLKTRKVITIYTTGGPKWFYNLPFGPALLKKQIKGLFSIAGVKKKKQFKVYEACDTGKCTPEHFEVWFKNLEKGLEKDF